MSKKCFVTHNQFFGTKLRGKHRELEHKKAIRNVLLLKQILTNEKHDERKLYTIITEFIPSFDEKVETIDYEPSREVS